jgi:cystathionine beta-lyase family protein involved in aluminum resistance
MKLHPMKPQSCAYALLLLLLLLTLIDSLHSHQVVKQQDPSVLVLVDNCYGEMTEELEPPAVGAGE